MDRSFFTVRGFQPVVVLVMLVVLAATGAPGALGAGTDGESALEEAPAPALAATSETVLQGPVDDMTYIVGPGDRFSITVWGQGVASYLATVTPEGELVVPSVATVPVAGRLLSEAKADLARSLESFYHDVEVSVSLVGLRSILVNVLGGVEVPGGYVGTVLDLAGELVRKSGGLSEGASSRNITITRRNGDTRRVDLVRYRNTGDVDANPPILDGDVIFVPHAVEFVHIEGAVARPGRYERVEGETIGSLIELAGGFARGAVADSVEVRQFVNDSETRYALVDADGPAGAETGLGDGDQVYVRALNEWRRPTRVEVEGEVKHPGPYGINEGTDRLSDVIHRAGGPTDEASLEDARLVRTLPWGGPDEEFERLQRMAVSEMSDVEYDYFRNRFRDRGVVVDFVRALGGDTGEDVLLMDGDLIAIPKTTTTVEVMGQVKNPGEVDHVAGKRSSYYIREAGGYGSVARKGRVRVIRGSTGRWVYARAAGALSPGDIIWVPERGETDLWKVIREVVAFLTSLATIYIVVDQATTS